jgi:acyl-CoA reductase-like NAD-dependent aldehyde dehydrogenase
VIIAGIHTHACVRQAALEAHERGIEVWIAADAVGSPEPLHAAQTEIYLEKRAIAFLSTDEILTRLDGGDTRSDHPVDRILAGAAVPEGSMRDRAAILEKAAELILSRASDLAARLVADTGKPIAQARDEAGRVAALFRSVARRSATQHLEEREPEALVVRRPHGVVAVITPWNNPLAIFAGQFAPAFVYGNAVIWKPAVEGTQCAIQLRELLLEAGVPSAALQIAAGGGRTGMALASHPAVDAVCFTGANKNGWKMAQICAAAHKPLQAELGGNNGAILWCEGARLESAAGAIASAAFGFAGQRCTATRRVIVPAAGFELALAALQRATADIVWGDPWNEGTEAGPLVSAAAAARVAAVVDRARQAGCKVFQPHLETQGALVSSGAYYPPSLVICDDLKAEIAQEETFGPVLVVQSARDWKEAMDLLNGVRQGLAACLFCDDHALQERFLLEARAGILKINQATAGAGADVPFGGWKHSGIGTPQHGRSNLEFFTRTQTLYRGEPEGPEV